MVQVQTIKLNNGKHIPVFGLGTWKSKPEDVVEAVKYAIDIGYRHIDCAYVYQNEKDVGKALKAKIDDGTIKREDIFVTSKLWNTFHRPALVEGALRESLNNLGLDYLDLYLIHSPRAFKEGSEIFPRDAAGNIIHIDIDYVDTWKAMEEVYKKGLAKSIGVSNFSIDQIERLLATATVKPTVNQVECHPYLSQKSLIDYCKSKDIVITAYSPLGSPDRPEAKPNDFKLMDDPRLKDVAAKYKKSPAQILLRYHVDRGYTVIPKSVTKSRIQQNFDIFDFSLSKEDIAYLDSFDRNRSFLRGNQVRKP